jgi:hypothetical protein
MRLQDQPCALGGRKEAVPMIGISVLLIRLISAIVELAVQAVSLAIRIAELRRKASEKPKPGE